VPGVDDVRVAHVRPDGRPVVVRLQDRLVLGVRRRAVPGDEDRLGHRRVDVLQDGEQQRGTTGVPHQHGVLAERVARQHRGQERGDRLDVQAGIVRYLDGVPARGQPPAQPAVPAHVRAAAGAVEDDRVAPHPSGSLLNALLRERYVMAKPRWHTAPRVVLSTPDEEDRGMKLRGRFAALVIALLGLVGGAVAVPAAGSAATGDPYCGITWGRGDKSTGSGVGAPLLITRTGQHDCYDRLVFEVDGPASGAVNYAHAYTQGSH